MRSSNHIYNIDAAPMMRQPSFSPEGNIAMKRLFSGALALTLLLGTTGLAGADQYRGGNYNNQGQYSQYNDRGHNDRRDWRHNDRRDWRQGQRVDRREWGNWDRVDYRYYRLDRPRRGYEWRRAPDGRYVEIALATGLIIAILNSR